MHVHVCVLPSKRNKNNHIQLATLEVDFGSTCADRVLALVICEHAKRMGAEPSNARVDWILRVRVRALFGCLPDDVAIVIIITLSLRFSFAAATPVVAAVSFCDTCERSYVIGALLMLWV